MNSAPRQTSAQAGNYAGGTSALLTVSGVGFDYEDSAILGGIDLSVGQGEFVALVGPSGCGKSTLLNLISGVLTPESGQISIAGLDGQSSRLGRVSYMQQDDLLLPWRTIEQNGRLGLELHGVSNAESGRLVRELADSFGLADVLDSMPWQLSGGMRQRVALLRALLPDNRVLLLDEPFGALDAITRGALQQWMLNVLDRASKAVLLVTHDVEEAVLLADRVLVMAPNPGRIVAETTVKLEDRTDPEVTTSASFVAIKRQIRQLLNDRVATL
ncbi:MAG: ABC transporter ATP-binding protein [Chloroflexi bacterium]|nr:ABC transporter ATP-binding protein [Chloroflexota bacterium]